MANRFNGKEIKAKTPKVEPQRAIISGTSKDDEGLSFFISHGKGFLKVRARDILKNYECGGRPIGVGVWVWLFAVGEG